MSDNPIKEAIEALYKPIESIVKTLAGPAAEEIGLSFRDSVQAWRLKRQIRLFEKVKDICKEAGIKPQAVKLPLLFDIVERASLEDNDDLQTLWANLLANASDPENQTTITPAYPEILRQLTKEEAVWLADFYHKQCSTSEELAEMTRSGTDIRPLDILEIYKDNLKRLRLIDWPDTARPRFVYVASDYFSKQRLMPTAFGEAFINACTSPKDKKRKEG